MLRMIRSMRELNFRALTDVYCDNEEILGHHDQGPERRLDAEQEFYRYLKEVFFCTSEACYAVWARDGRYLAALRIEPYRDGLLIAALETAPGARGNGYATALLSAVLQKFNNRIFYSHVRKDNITSLRVHEKCGFICVSDSAVMLSGSVTLSHCTLCFGM